MPLRAIPSQPSWPALARSGVELAVVHGGGKQMTRFLAERGIESRFVNGLRVTTPETIDAVLKVFAGSVNHELVASLNRAGALAVGLTGIDALAGRGRADGSGARRGRPRRALQRRRCCNLLAGGGYLPVVACVAGDRQGKIYNVNADQMAVACAAAFGAEQLVFLTDVDGVLDAAKRGPPAAHGRATAAQLIADGVATGGMQAKLNAALAALAGGVGQVRIAPGAAAGVLARILAGEAIGTGWCCRREQRHDQRCACGLFRGVAGRPRLTVRKAVMHDIPAILHLINGYAAKGIMLPRTEFEMSEAIRDFTVVTSTARVPGLRRAALLQSHHGRDPLARRPRACEDPRRGPQIGGSAGRGSAGIRTRRRLRVHLCCDFFNR